MQTHTLRYRDSLGNEDRGATFLTHILSYLRQLYPNIHPGQSLPEDWAPELDPPQDTPAQHNGYDCGVFLCAITDCLFRHEPLQFTESHLPAYRELMALALLQQSAPPWSDPFMIVRSSP
jgi:Ulp1 family protease